VGHVAGREEGRGVYRVSVGRPEDKRPLGRLGVGERITLRWTLGIKRSRWRTGLGWLRIGSSGEFCKHGNEPSGSIKKRGYFLAGLVTIKFSNNILHHGVSK
jgi:hypothetical protein